MKNYSKLYNREHYSRWSDSEKKKAVLLYLSGDYTKNSIAKDFGVSNAGLSKWINRFAEEILVLQKKKKTRPKPWFLECFNQLFLIILTLFFCF